MKLQKKHYINIAFILVGALGGFLYWKFVGCKSGACPIKSRWYLMILYGSVLGYLLGDILQGLFKKKQNTGAETDKNQQ